jgi:hypothetical protein
MVRIEIKTHNNIYNRAWTNLVDYAHITTDGWRELVAVVESELQKFNAVAPAGTGKEYLEFINDEDLMSFLLTWS